jgi:hypothetical protein
MFATDALRRLHRAIVTLNPQQLQLIEDQSSDGIADLKAIQVATRNAVDILGIGTAHDVSFSLITHLARRRARDAGPCRTPRSPLQLCHAGFNSPITQRSLRRWHQRFRGWLTQTESPISDATVSGSAKSLPLLHAELDHTAQR